MHNNEYKVLIVDDDPNNIIILELDLEDEGYEIITAQNAYEAQEKLAEHADGIKAILLDRMMPGMSGIELLKEIKQNESTARLPVILQTAAAEKSQVAEGIEAGAYYYLTKPYDKEIMLSVVRAAVNDYADYSNLLKEVELFKPKFGTIKESVFEIKHIDEIRYLATFISNFYPDPKRVIFGISELLLNAIEHGNLGVDYKRKTELLKNNALDEEIERLSKLADNENKKVSIYFKMKDNEILLSIKDEGEGFDWSDYMEISPERAMDSHGRGIALAKMMSFDSIEYIDPGNEVICKIKLENAVVDVQGG